MINPFRQSKVTYKIYFKTFFNNIPLFEELIYQIYEKNILSISSYEVFSESIESLPDDIWCLEIYLECKPVLSAFKQRISEFCLQNNLKILERIYIEKIKDQDWVAAYEKELKPIEIGPFFIANQIFKSFCPSNKKGIFIDASRAFGTGDHMTTRSCIESLNILSTLNFYKIIDIGTGTGILAFAAEHFWPKANIYGCDIEDVAVNIARENKKINNSNVFFYKNSPTEILLPKIKNEKFDLIISNILADPLINLSPIIHQISSDNAYIILSGFLISQMRRLIVKYKELGIQLINTIIHEQWVCLTFKVKKN